jgi:hypothetical protein
MYQSDFIKIHRLVRHDLYLVTKETLCLCDWLLLAKNVSRYYVKNSNKHDQRNTEAIFI